MVGDYFEMISSPPVRDVFISRARSMSKAELKKIEVKVALAEKYERLASVAGSIPKRNTWRFHANHFRNQVKAMRDKLGIK